MSKSKSPKHNTSQRRRCTQCQRELPRRSYRTICASDAKRARGMLPVQERERTATGWRFLRRWEKGPASVVVSATMMRDLARAARETIAQSFGIGAPGMSDEQRAPRFALV